MRVIPVTEENRGAVDAFLRAHADTALFLLSNLAAWGPRLGTAPNSGNFKCIAVDGAIRAVFVLSRRGNLILETGGRTDFTAAVTDACAGEPVELRGVIGQWESARAAWEHLRAEGRVVERFGSREWLYALELSVAARSPAGGGARALVPADFAEWEGLSSAFMVEAGIPNERPLEERRAGFERDARAGYFWGYYDAGRLVAVACLTAVEPPRGQVGGVFTAPAHRRRGRCRAVMQKLIDDSARVHGLTRLVLFTGEENRAAQGLYEALGFERVGEFGLFFGGPAPAPRG